MIKINGCYAATGWGYDIRRIITPAQADFDNANVSRVFRKG